MTAALNWQPRRRLRVTAEALRVDRVRVQRSEYGLDPKSIETQFQLSARLLY